MIGRALQEGVRAATRRPGLVALLWAWNLALALLAALPFYRWIAGASAVFPETDVLLDGADLGIITQLVQADPALVPSLLAGVLGLVAVSLVSGAFLSGGILEVVMTEGDGRPLLHRFFRGAGHFFGRFLRLLAIAGISLGIVGGVIAAALAGVTRPLANGGSEPAGLWGTVIVQGGVGLVIAFFMLAHDYARAMTVITGTRSMLRTWWRALRFVARHSLAAATIGLLAALVVMAALGACAAFDIAFSARTWSVIAGAVLLQQAMALVRTAARVGQVGAQAVYCRGLLPLAAPVTATCSPVPPASAAPGPTSGPEAGAQESGPPFAADQAPQSE